MGELDGLVTIVTGAGRGIGRALALEFAAQGAHVVLTAARERAEIEDVARAAEANGASGRILPLVADVADAASCEHVAAQTVERFGQIDVLVNNAARGMKYVSPNFVTSPPPFWEIDPEVWKMVIATNLTGPFLMARAVVPHMLQRQSGSIINVSISYETMKRRGFSPYGPSKAGLEAASAIWAQDLEGTGIRLNELLPGGMTATGMLPQHLSDEMRQRLLDPAIVAAPAVYLASPRSRLVTGRRLVATEWTPEHPDGQPISAGIGAIGAIGGAGGE